MNIKPRSWRAAARDVEEISKRSPTSIDPAIKEVVIGLRAFRLPTEASCIGHLKIWGAPYPWIQFRVAKGRKTYVQLRKLVLQHQKTLHELLDCFYREHQPQRFEDTLSTHFFKNNKWGVFSLQSVGAQFLEECPSSIQARIVPHLRAEMRAFGRFLHKQII